MGVFHDFCVNCTHNLFKPLLLFFYLGFLIPLLPGLKFEFPKAVYQSITLYLLVAIGWHGGEELAKVSLEGRGASLPRQPGSCWSASAPTVSSAWRPSLSWPG